MPATKPNSKTATVNITEGFAAQKEQPDLETGIVRGVKILGFESKNGRTYPAPVMRAGVACYEGAKVNFDHPTSGNPHEPRQYKDRFGVIRDARFTEGAGIFGDLHFNPKHGLAPQFAWDVKNNPNSLGFSHNATLRLGAANAKGQTVVEQICSVKHVDLVADPATTSSLFESENSMDDMPITAAPADPLEMIVDAIAAQISTIAKGTEDPKAKMKAIADLLKKQDKVMALLAAKPEAASDAETEGLKTQLQALSQQLEQFQAKEKAAQTQAAIQTALEANGLDPKNPAHVSELFRKQLQTLESEADRLALIKDRAALVLKAGAAAPVSQSGHGVTEQIDAKRWIR